MNIPDHLLQEFKEQYRKDFKEKLSDKEVYDRFTRVANVLRIIRRYVKITMEDIEAVPDDENPYPPYELVHWELRAVERLTDSQKSYRWVPGIEQITWRY